MKASRIMQIPKALFLLLSFLPSISVSAAGESDQATSSQNSKARTSATASKSASKAPRAVSSKSASKAPCAASSKSASKAPRTVPRKPDSFEPSPEVDLSPDFKRIVADPTRQRDSRVVTGSEPDLSLPKGECDIVHLDACVHQRALHSPCPYSILKNPTFQTAAESIMEKRARAAEKLTDNQLTPRQLNFRCKGGQYLQNASDPRTLNEHIWFVSSNFHYSSEATSWYCNKLAAKLFVLHTIGPKYVTRVYAVLEDVAEVYDYWDRLPQIFVVKGFLGSFGRFVVIIDKNDPRTFESLSKIKYAKTSRLTKQARYLIEEYLPPIREGRRITDFKFFCTFGRIIFIAVGDGPAEAAPSSVNQNCKSLFAVQLGDIPADAAPASVDSDCNPRFTVLDCVRLPVTYCGRHLLDFDLLDVVPREVFAEVIYVVQKLSFSFPFIRIDMFLSPDENGKLRIRVGEITNLPAWGSGVFDPVTFDYLAGAFIPRLNKFDFEMLHCRDYVATRRWILQLKDSPDFMADIVMPEFKCCSPIDFDSLLQASRQYADPHSEMMRRYNYLAQRYPNSVLCHNLGDFKSRRFIRLDGGADQGADINLLRSAVEPFGTLVNPK
jgi:hypothetical protein